MEKKLTIQDKKKLREQNRKEYEQDWLAPLGSEQERQLLRIWRKRGALSSEDQKLIDEWLRSPEGVKRGRDPLFFYTAKEKYLGKVVWKTALERHEQLDDSEWLVAYFTAEGKSQKRIATLTHLSERRIDEITRNIKEKVSLEFMWDAEEVTLPQITRWFLGL